MVSKLLVALIVIRNLAFFDRNLWNWKDMKTQTLTLFLVHNESSWAHVKTKKHGVKTFDCSHCDKKFGLLLWQEFLKYEGTKSMVSILLVALLNSLSHTWQWKKVQNALFQVSYFMLYRMVSLKFFATDQQTNTTDRFHCRDSFMLLQKKPLFLSIDSCFQGKFDLKTHYE